jgi:hypothetical protein
MAIKLTNFNPPPKAPEDLFEEASASVAAQTLLQALGPQLDKALELRLAALFSAPPELGALCDARAQLKAIYDLKKGLADQMKKGQSAVEIFNQLLLRNI